MKKSKSINGKKVQETKSAINGTTKSALQDVPKNATKDVGRKLYLSQILGDVGNGRFGTVNESDYEAKINEMNKSDLITHASKVGIVPKNDAPRLRKELLKEFKKHIVNYNLPSAPKSKVGAIGQLSPLSQRLLADAK